MTTNTQHRNVQTNCKCNDTCAWTPNNLFFDHGGLSRMGEKYFGGAPLGYLGLLLAHLNSWGSRYPSRAEATWGYLGLLRAHRNSWGSQIITTKQKSFPDAPRDPSGSKKPLPAHQGESSGSKHRSRVRREIIRKQKNRFRIYASWGYRDYLWGYLGLPLITGILGILDIYAGWGYWGCLGRYLGLPLSTGIPGDLVYLCWLGLLGLPLGLHEGYF
jgi:hypothetical protein